MDQDTDGAMLIRNLDDLSALTTKWQIPDDHHRDPDESHQEHPERSTTQDHHT